MLNSFVIRKDKKIPGSDAMSVFILRPWNLQVSCKYRTLEDSCNFSIISWPLALDAPLTVVKPGSLLPFRTWRLCLKELPFIWGLSRVSPKYMEISSFGQNLSRNVRKSSPKSHDVRPRDFVTVSIRLKTWVVVSIIFLCSPRSLGNISNLTNIFQMGLKPPTRNSFPPMDSFTDAASMRGNIPGGYTLAKAWWQALCGWWLWTSGVLLTTKNATGLEIQMISDLVWGKS